MASKCRQNYHEECEAAVNRQINMELNACIAYMALVMYYVIKAKTIQLYNVLLRLRTSDVMM
jgi:hypothetical protein